jgi:two-component system cell cycle response regulator
VRSFDLVARYGGEEFLVVMPETPTAVAVSVAERLRLAMAETPFMLTAEAVEIPVTISIGVATMRDEADTPALLLKRADEALYAAKNAGRNRVIAWPVVPAEEPRKVATG